MTQPYSPHQVHSGLAVSSEYPMGNTPGVPTGAIPPHLNGSAETNGQLGDIGAADAAVAAAGQARSGAGVLDVPRQGGHPGNSGS